MASHEPDSQPQHSPKALEIMARTNELLAIGGYAGFSYADIAERVNVKKASIHHHFPTKADLVKATVARHRQATRRGLESLEQLAADPLERLVAYARFWAECIRESNPSICICALLAAEMPALPGEVADEVKAHFHDLHAWIALNLEHGAARGTVRLADTPSAEASTLHGVYPWSNAGSAGGE